MTLHSPPPDRYWPIARDKPGLLIAMMKALAGDAHISFEGDLAEVHFPELLGGRLGETEALLRHTAAPRQDFIVLPLVPASVRPILDVVLKENRFMETILHIQIEKGGELAFGAYDQFHPECTVCFPPNVTPELLDRLQQSSVIRSWSLPYVGARRWHG